MRGCGCIGHPAFPAPSFIFRAKNPCKARADCAARTRSRVNHGVVPKSEYACHRPRGRVIQYSRDANDQASKLAPTYWILAPSRSMDGGGCLQNFHRIYPHVVPALSRDPSSRCLCYATLVRQSCPQPISVPPAFAGTTRGGSASSYSSSGFLPPMVFSLANTASTLRSSRCFSVGSNSGSLRVVSEAGSRVAPP